jgi:UPF0755 protein
MKKRNFILSAFAILAVIVLIIVVYRNMTWIKVDPKQGKKEIFIRTGSTYDQALTNLDSALGIKNPVLFNWIAKKMKYEQNVKAGRYVIESDLSYLQLINLLRSGRQTPVKVIFNNIRTLNQLAGKIGTRIEADSTEIINFLNNESNYSADGFNKETIISIFIPNTYQFFWNTDAKGLYSRMLKEYKSFWNDQRKKKAEGKGLKPIEVSILASIVDDEVAKGAEKPRIAGVYLNRLKIGMPLQSCPTIRFALNDFTITRVLKKHLVIESPYNTYKYRGLPPGPVGCPSIQGIDAVLNAEKHDYLYFAAKADFSGSHNFSRTLNEHNRYAAQYQRELDRRKIFK